MKELLSKNWRPVLIAVLSTVGLINTVPQVKQVVVPEPKAITSQTAAPCTSVITEEQMVRVLQKLRQIPPPKFEFKLQQELR